MWLKCSILLAFVYIANAEDFLEFKKPVYVAQYIDSCSIKLEDITVNTDDKVVFEIVSAYKQNFEFNNNKLTIIEDLHESVFRDNNYITVTIHAKYKKEDSIFAETIVIITGPRKIEIPVFEKTLYEMENTKDFELELKLKDENDKTVTFEIISGNKGYVKLDKNKLTLNEKIPDSEFIDKSYISITIEATYEATKEKGRTVVVINGPYPKTIEIPVFEKTLYEMENTKDFELELKLKDENDKTVTFEIISGNKGYVKLDKNKLTLNEKIPDSEFIDKSYISITIEATYEATKEKGRTVVVINGPSPTIIEIPVFEKTLYEMENTKDFELELKLKDENDKTVTFEIISGNKGYVKLDKNKLTLNEKIPDSEFIDKSYISITIEATYEATKEKGRTVVVINGPYPKTIEIPIFEKTLYEMENTKDFELELKLKDENDKTVTFEIISGNKGYVKLDKNKLTLNEKIPDSEFIDKSYISITIEATYEATKEKGRTVVVINGPYPKTIEIPVFEKTLYEMENTKDFELELKLKDENDKTVTFEIISGNKGYVKLDKNKLTLNEKIPDSEFIDKSYISITIEATYEATKEKGRTVVVINGPSPTIIEIPVFEKTLYEMENTKDFELELKLKDENDKTVTFEIISGNKGYVKLDKNKLTLNEKIPDSEFIDKSYISITIEATYEATKQKGRTVVVINGPSPTIIEIPVFEKTLYEMENTKDFELELKLKDENNKTVTFEIISGNKGYVKLDKNKLTLNEKIPDSEFIDKSYISITIEATYEATKEKGRTVVVINGPYPKTIEIPVFEKTLYEMENTKDFELELKLKDENDKTVTFEIISGNKGYVKLDKNKLTLNEKIPDSEFIDKSYISITIEATYEATKEKGRTVVVINGPSPTIIEIPVFEKTLYEMENTKDFELELKLKDENDKTVTFEIISGNKGYVKLDKNKLTLNEKIPDSEFIDKSYISITIEATYEATKQKGRTVVVINGPYPKTIEIPIFEKTLYEMENTKDFELELKLKDENDKTVTFEIISGNKGYVKLDKNKLTLNEKIPDSEFIDKSYISITIEATYEATKQKGRTVVVINGPSPTIIEIPVFEKTLYEMENTKDFELELKLKDENNKTVTFEIISGNKGYVKLDKNKLTLNEKIPDSEFIDKSYISITIEATYEATKEKGRTVVVINGPYPKTIEIPVFEKTLYEMENTKDFELELKLKDENDKTVTFEIISGNKGYVKLDKNKLTLNEKIPDSEFIDKSYISITIEATYEATKEKGRTVVVINGPYPKTIEIPVFEKTLYEMENTKDFELELKLKDENDKTVTFEIISGNKGYVKLDKNKLTLNEKIPDSEFIDKSYISITIEATYEATKQKGRTVVVINGPSPTIIEIPVFEKTLYEMENTKDFELELKLKDENDKTVTFEIISGNKGYVKLVKNKLTLNEKISDSEFIDKSYISITIEAKYEATKETGSTVVVINGPYPKTIEIPVFEKTLYEMENTKDFELELKLKDEDDKAATFKIISGNKGYVKLVKNKLTLTEKIPDSEFIDKNYISITIEATYDATQETGNSVVIIKGSKQTVHYEKHIGVVGKDPPLTGLIGKYEATSDDSSKLIEYKITSDNLNLFKYTPNGELRIKGILPDKLYYQITLLAKTSDSQDTMDVILFANRALSWDDFKFKDSLKVVKVNEGEGPTKIVNALPGYKLSIIGDNTEGWFEIEGNNMVVNEIDREHPKLKDMLVAQVQIQVKAEKITTLKSFNTTINKIYDISRKQESCLVISKIPIRTDTMYVVVTIEDINDQPPVFVEKNPLVIGYPSSKLAEFIAPPYLVKVTATDDDIGINAVIRYSVDKNFRIDPVNGIIYPAKELSSDTEFTVTATDKNGAEDGIRTPLRIKVKILDENHMNVIKVKNIAYSGIEDFIANLSKETKTTVKYLSSTALPKAGTAEENKNLRLAKVDDKIPVLRIVLYALDNEKVVPAAEFKKLIENSDISESIEIKQYEANAEECTDDTGYIAAISTLAILLALVIIGFLVGYFCCIRPKIVEDPSQYGRHNNDFMHNAPVERMEPRTFDGRPRRFPIDTSRWKMSR